ncbi:chorismate mutase [Sinobacterium caligoides]|uniref:chorismate mutase n=1 Tax=Sinobacterium caligoides TaxID=933926 RepID=A0A3N2DZZ2_9GAMM|nr:chorismate mutase [Sinobacterium caligoides]ROS05398.1 chorismate mutase [Sinobacterium caligoides]
MKYIAYFLFSIVSAAANSDEVSSELFSLINARLSYMEDVAIYKSKRHRPVEDLERERITVDNSKRSAKRNELNPAYIEAFFKAQIDVAKAIRFRSRADMLTHPSSKFPRDLITDVRPCLIHLGDQITDKMRAYLDVHGSFESASFEEFNTAINVQYVTASDKQLLFRSLRKVKSLQREGE